MKFISGLALFVFSIFAIAFARGYVVRQLWAWFVVPTFGLPALSLSAALGVSLLLYLVTYQMPPNVETKPEGYFASMGRILIASLSIYGGSLLTGWLYLNFF